MCIRISVGVSNVKVLCSQLFLVSVGALALPNRPPWWRILLTREVRVVFSPACIFHAVARFYFLNRAVARVFVVLGLLPCLYYVAVAMGRLCWGVDDNCSTTLVAYFASRVVRVVFYPRLYVPRGCAFFACLAAWLVAFLSGCPM